jgi:hypothetical protein
MRRSFGSAGRSRVHARLSSGVGGTVESGSRPFDGSAGTGWRAILRRTRRSGRSAPHPSGCVPADLKGALRRLRSLPVPSEKCVGNGPEPIRDRSERRRAVGRGCLQPVRRVPAGGSRSRSRARPRPSHGSGFCARSLDARSGPLERDRIQSGPAASSCRSPPAPEASGALRSGARCAGSFTGSRRT